MSLSYIQLHIGNEKRRWQNVSTKNKMYGKNDLQRVCQQEGGKISIHLHLKTL